MRVHLDFETYAEVDLGKRGLKNYLACPRFEVTLTALAFDDGPVVQWEGFPGEMLRFLALCEGFTWHAFNAPFERGCLSRYGVQVPPDRWRCTMSHAYCRAFSGGLKDVGAQIGLPVDKAKLDDGRKLVLKFAKPAPKNHNVARYTKENSPEAWDRFMLYNRQDVVAEREVWRYLNRYPWTPEEQRLWELDQRINLRGVPVDVAMATAAIDKAAEAKKQLDLECRKLTSHDPRAPAFGIGVNQTALLLQWLRGEGYESNDLKAETVREALEEHENG